MKSATLLWLPPAALVLLALTAGGGALQLRKAGPPEPPAPALPVGQLWAEAQRLIRAPAAPVETAPQDTPSAQSPALTAPAEPALAEEELRRRAQAFIRQVEQSLAPWQACLETSRDAAAAARRAGLGILWALSGLAGSLALVFAFLASRRLRQEADFAETLQTFLDGEDKASCPSFRAEVLGPCHAALGRMLLAFQRLQVQMGTLCKDRMEMEKKMKAMEMPARPSRPGAPPPPAPRAPAPPVLPAFVPAAMPMPQRPPPRREEPLPLSPTPTQDEEETYFFLDLASHKERVSPSGAP